MRDLRCDHCRRIAALERSLARARTCGALTVLVAIALIGGGLATRRATRQPEELTVSKLVVVDDKGVARIVIGQDPPDAQRISRATGITIRDATGAERFGVGIMESGVVNMGFDAPVGVGNAMRDRIGIGVGPKGEAYVMLIDNDTKVPVRLAADADGGGGVEFIDYNCDAGKVIVKRLNFTGEERSEFAHEFPPEAPKRK